MKIIAFTDNPSVLISLINKKISDKELKTWEIVKSSKDDVLYSHIPEQWKEKAMPKPVIYNGKVEFIMRWWNDDEPDEATKGYILGRFVELLMVHFNDKFSYLEIK